MEPVRQSRSAGGAEPGQLPYRVRIGISGWRYVPWRGVFYPQGLPQRAELTYAAERLSSLEINGSFYALQRPSSYQSWYDQTPSGFEFAVKGPRFVTHMKKLADAETPLANFFASGVLALGDKLGPVLWQLPPNLGYDPDRLERFFRLLPRSTSAAAALAAHHDHRLEGRALIQASMQRRVRHALEVRHRSFQTPEFLELLARHDIGCVCADSAGVWPMFEAVTADFAYVRLHGSEELYTSGYDEQTLRSWAAKVEAWRSSGDVYVYFDNDVKVRAPFDAMRLAELMSAGPN